MYRKRRKYSENTESYNPIQKAVKDFPVWRHGGGPISLLNKPL